MAEFLKECPHVQCSPDNVMVLECDRSPERIQFYLDFTVCSTGEYHQKLQDKAINMYYEIMKYLKLLYNIYSCTVANIGSTSSMEIVVGKVTTNIGTIRV